MTELQVLHGLKQRRKQVTLDLARASVDQFEHAGRDSRRGELFENDGCGTIQHAHSEEATKVRRGRREDCPVRMEALLLGLDHDIAQLAAAPKLEQLRKLRRNLLACSHRDEHSPSLVSAARSLALSPALARAHPRCPVGPSFLPKRVYILYRPICLALQ